jgi:hypothetical protein
VRSGPPSNIEAAKYYPEDDEFLLEREDVVRHYEVWEPPSR